MASSLEDSFVGLRGVDAWCRGLHECLKQTDFLFTGYNWNFVNGVLTETAHRDSMLVEEVVAQKVLCDPISKKFITDAVRSSKCLALHLYERACLESLLSTARDPRGMKCAYLGCGNYIGQQDVIMDDEYMRFLARNPNQPTEEEEEDE